MLTCYVYSTKIGEISDISKCFENFVSQALGVLTRIYAAELRKNNTGSPDYADNRSEVQTRRASLLRGTSEDQIDQTAPQLEAAAIRVWTHEGVLYIESDRRARAEVYTRSGALYKRIDVAEGQTREPLAEGFYVVVIDGKTHKVIVR